MNLSEYMRESLLSKKTGIYGKNMSEESIRQKLINQLYLEVASELKATSEKPMVIELHEMAESDCLWAEFVSDDGDLMLFLAGKDDYVAKLTFTSGIATEGVVYEIHGRKIRTSSKNLSDAIKYFEHWTDDEPF